MVDQAELQPLAQAPIGERVENELDKPYLLLLECLGYDPTPVDEVVERSGLTADAVSSMLLVLELQGLVAVGTGGLYVRLTPGTTQ
ncbi:MAG TPA: hypothetical protein VHJ19_08440 [Gammaproteobacteria bacterium]|nr:hypothetical protein [Gammaproteobacteria bacterium]